MTQLDIEDKASSLIESVDTDERFAFGENWRLFLSTVDESHIDEAERSLREMLNVESLEGRTFVDVGCGSGLFSLAARRLGARVHSFDYDLASVRCAEDLRSRFDDGSEQWTIERGSILDGAYVEQLGQFDVVYSWGVLHHTGAMWDAIDLAMNLVTPSGVAFIAIYNDLDAVTRRWAAVKRFYVRASPPVRTVVVALCAVRLWGMTIVRDLLKGDPLCTVRERKQARGMSAWRDVVDWVGGHPYEVATAEQIIQRFATDGFVLQRLVTRCGIGCNEFVFHKVSSELRTALAQIGVLPRNEE